MRGTPQQIVEKYQSLARDAQLSGDRVAGEAFQQHAEHYLRVLNEATREQNERREAHEAQQAQRRENQQNSQNQNTGNEQNVQPSVDPQNAEQPDVVAPVQAVSAEKENGNGLVDTPENKPKSRSRRPKPKAPETATEQVAE